MRVAAIGVVVSLLAVGCGDRRDNLTGSPTVLPLSGWGPVPTLTELPPGETFDHDPTRWHELVIGEVPNAVYVTITADDTNLRSCDFDTDTVSVFDPPEVDRIRNVWVYTRTLDGAAVLLVVGERAGTPRRGVMLAYLDSNSDGLFVATDLVVELLDPRVLSEGSSWSDVATDDDGRALLVDAVNHQVLIVSDTNSDGIPEALSTTPFFDSTHSSLMDRLGFVRFNTVHQCVDLFAGDPSGDALGALVRARDTNGDDVADEVKEVDYSTDDLGVRFGRTLVAGDQVAVVLDSNANQALEVWAYDPDTGTEVSLLGSVTTGVAEVEVSVTLSSPLVEGQMVILRREPAGGRVASQLVFDGVVEVATASPETVTGSGSETVTLTGWRFDAGTTVTVTFPSTEASPEIELVQDIPLTITSGGTTAFTFPAIPAAGVPDGRVYLTFIRNGEVLGRTGDILTLEQ